MMGQEIKEPALHPAPNLGLFLSWGPVLLALGLPPRSVFSVQQIQSCLGFCHLAFPTFHN